MPETETCAKYKLFAIPTSPRAQQADGKTRRKTRTRQQTARKETETKRKKERQRTKSEAQTQHGHKQKQENQTQQQQQRKPSGAEQHSNSQQRGRQDSGAQRKFDNFVRQGDECEQRQRRVRCVNGSVHCATDKAANVRCVTFVHAHALRKPARDRVEAMLSVWCLSQTKPYQCGAPPNSGRKLNTKRR